MSFEYKGDLAERTQVDYLTALLHTLRNDLQNPYRSSRIVSANPKECTLEYEGEMYIDGVTTRVVTQIRIATIKIQSKTDASH